MTTTLLKTQNLGRRIEGKWLWQNVSIAITTGDRITLSGPSGSGKSLLLRTLALLERAEQGEIQWHGGSVRDVPRFRSQCMYVQQQVSFSDGTVTEALRAPYLLEQHQEKHFDQMAIQGVLRQLGRDSDFLSKQLGKLSGGERQIVAIVRALQLQPQVLLLDEPTGALDGPTARHVEQLITAWVKEKQTERAFVWVSHDPEQATRVSNQRWQINGDATISITADLGHGNE